MNSFKELVLSFFEASRERLKNPAVGTFVLAWIAINWRFVSILFFSNSQLEDRIKLIEECYLRLDLNLWFPLIAMGVYMLIIPNLMALFDALSQKAISYRKELSNKNKLNDIITKNDHRLKDVIAQQEIAAEERQLEIIEEGSPDVTKLKERIEKLESENRNLLTKLSERIPVQKSKPDLNDDSANDEKSKSTSATTTTKSSTRPKRKTTSDSESTPLPTSPNFPAMRDNVIRNVAKSEREWILLYAFYSSNFGKKEFTRKDLMNAYSESKRRTSQRIKNLTLNINTLVKQGSITFLNDEDILLTDSGVTLAKEILNR